MSELRCCYCLLMLLLLLMLNTAHHTPPPLVLLHVALSSGVPEIPETLKFLSSTSIREYVCKIRCNLPQEILS